MKSTEKTNLLVTETNLHFKCCYVTGAYLTARNVTITSLLFAHSKICVLYLVRVTGGLVLNLCPVLSSSDHRSVGPADPSCHLPEDSRCLSEPQILKCSVLCF